MMNRFLITSALVGSTMGFFHGRAMRQTPQPIPKELMYSVRDAAIGAVVYPFIIPIGLYQIAAQSNAQTCIFKDISFLFSKPQTETLK
jgi:hypothetical protein